MKQFQFRLERLLELRAQHERGRAKELATAAQVEEGKKKALKQANERLDVLSEQMEKIEGRITPAGTLRSLALTVEAAMTDISHAEKSHDVASKSLETEHQRFAEANRDRRVLERLKEVRQATWHVDASRAEQRDEDESAINQHLQKGSGPCAP
jgi:flagellar FliJ protein